MHILSLKVKAGECIDLSYISCVKMRSITMLLQGFEFRAWYSTKTKGWYDIDWIGIKPFYEMPTLQTVSDMIFGNVWHPPKWRLVWQCHCSAGDPRWTLCQPWPSLGCHTWFSDIVNRNANSFWTEPTVNGRIAWNDSSNDGVSQQLVPLIRTWSGLLFFGPRDSSLAFVGMARAWQMPHVWPRIYSSKKTCANVDMGKSRILDILNGSRIIEIRLLHFVTVETDSALNCHILIQILRPFVLV